MTPTITIFERLAAFGGASMVACMIFAIATVLHRIISKRDRAKQLQGEPIRYWVTACFVLGAAWGAGIADNVNYVMHEVVGGLGGFGILIGWAIGMFHGFARMSYLAATRVDVATHSSVDPTNPYSPPGYPKTKQDGG